MDISDVMGFVNEVWATFHYHPDGPPSLITLNLLKEGRWIELRTTSSGWGIALTPAAPQAVDMGEYGEVRVVRVDRDHPAGVLEGHSVLLAHRLLAIDVSPLPMGYALYTEANMRCAVWNSGDELHVGTEGPHETLFSEVTEESQ